MKAMDFKSQLMWKRISFVIKKIIESIILFQLVQHVLEGEGVGWLKLNRLKKLMEDESYRNMVLSKLNRNFNRKTTPNDKVDDVVSSEFTEHIIRLNIFNVLI